MPTRSITFTGTQRGMTQAQQAHVSAILGDFRPEIVRHGGCIGGDAQFHALALALSAQNKAKGKPKIHVWFSNITAKTAPIALPYIMHGHYSPLVRNRLMVDAAACDEEGLVFACPGEREEQLRSGTWATIRYAREVSINLYVVYPSGEWDQSGEFSP